MIEDACTMKPLVSIVIPIYNTGAYLRRCLDSIVGQGLEGVELILVDDGSVDESPAICDEYAAAHADIRVLHQENQGVSAARNAGLELVRGDYVWFCDSDDRLLPGALDRLRALLLDAEPDLAIFPLVQEDADERQLGVMAAPDEASYLERGPLEAGDELFLSSHVLARGLIADARFDPALALFEDRDFLYWVCLRTKRHKVGEAPLYAYFVSREGSALNTPDPKKNLAGNRVHRDILVNEIELGRPETAYRIYVDQTLGALSLMVKKNECMDSFDSLRDEMLSFDSYNSLLNGSHRLKYTVCKYAPGLFKAMYRGLGGARR